MANVIIFDETIEEYDSACEAVRKENAEYLKLFEADLTEKGLSPKTIKNHISNVDLFINEFLLREDGGVFIISSLGVDNEECAPVFLRGYYKMRTLFPDSKIICLGNRINGMDNDILFVPYKESFGNWEQYPGYWQMSLLNTDGTLYFGGAV